MTLNNCIDPKLCGPKGGDDKPKVFIVQDTGTLNFTPALNFGDPVVINRLGYPPFITSFQKQWFRNLSQKLQQFNSERDYLLLVGDPISIALSFHIIAKYSQSIKCLRWDRQTMSYIPVIVKINGG